VTFLRTLLRRGGALSLVIALFGLLAACSTPADSGSADATNGDNTGGGTVDVVDGVVELSAADIAFDASVIEAPAGEAFTINFTNNDSAPHNVAIYTEQGGDEIVKGDIIDPGQSVEVQVPAQEAGEYYFVCDLHTNMNGTVVVE
jgi:plastocyanin